MAGPQRLPHPGQHLVIELETAQQRGELLLEPFLREHASDDNWRPRPGIVGVL